MRYVVSLALAAALAACSLAPAYAGVYRICDEGEEPQRDGCVRGDECGPRPDEAHADAVPTEAELMRRLQAALDEARRTLKRELERRGGRT